jgi:hypothetical protein
MKVRGGKANVANRPFGRLPVAIKDVYGTDQNFQDAPTRETGIPPPADEIAARQKFTCRARLVLQK